MDLNINQLLQKAIEAHRKEDYEKATKLYKKILRRQPKNFNIYNNLGITLKKQKKIIKAEEVFKTAINLNPNFVDAYYNLGNLLRDKKRYQDALDCYKDAIALNPNFLEAYYNSATIFKNLSKYKEATTNYKKVLQLNPNLLEVKHLIASISGKTTDTAPRAYVEKLFDTYASEFDESLVNELDYKIPKVIYDLLINEKSLNPLGSILDLGCGTGLVGLELKKFSSRLVGVDLSNLMLAKAREKNVYDELIHQDIKDYLSNENLKYDYFIFADVFIYIGKLDEIFKLIKLRNFSKGKLIFTLELTDKSDFFLEKSGRYSHSKSYIDKLCIKNNYKILYSKKINLRKENNEMIQSILYLLDF